MLLASYFTLGIMYRLLLFVLCGVATFAGADQDWSVLEKLKGEWVGVGTGTPGDGIGSFSFLPEMKGRIYVRRNRAEYPA